MDFIGTHLCKLGVILPSRFTAGFILEVCPHAENDNTAQSVYIYEEDEDLKLQNSRSGCVNIWEIIRLTFEDARSLPRAGGGFFFRCVILIIHTRHLVLLLFYTWYW